MTRQLSTVDAEKLKRLIETRKRNNDVNWMLCNYLNDSPRMITKDLIDSVNIGGELTEETAYYALLSGLCGLDTENSEYDKQLSEQYFKKSVKKLSIDAYLDNPYYKNIHIADIKVKTWAFKHETYAPYEAFVYNDITIGDNFKEIQSIGYFDQEFKYPAIMEGNREWMAIKPNEIHTMQLVIDVVEGKVVTFGLGMGYFAYMASLKDNVESVTIVERDRDVAELFDKFIFPQFVRKDKIRIVIADAFDYIDKEMPREKYDCAFIDLWHDVSDGLEIYLNIKKVEQKFPQTSFYYWIEESLVSALRWQLFDQIIENGNTFEEVNTMLGSSFLKKLASTRLTIK